MKHAIKALGWSLPLLAFLLSACIATPAPDPPDLQPPNLDRLELAAPQGVGEPVPVRFTGQAGAAEANTVFWVAALDRADPPVTVPVEADGSFGVEVTGEPGQEMRIQLRRGEARSSPIDVLVPMTPGPGPVVQRDPCLTLSPALELELDGDATGVAVRGTITLDNACSGDVSVIGLRLREGNPAFTADPSTMPTVSPGAFAQVAVTFDGSAADEEDILLVDLTGAVTERRPVTLFGRVR